MDAVHARFAPGLRSLFLRRVGEKRADLADDLCQRTWMMTWNAILEGKYDPQRAAISTFLYAVANNAWLRHLRAAGRDGLNGHSGELEELENAMGPGADPGVPDVLTHAEELDAVRAFLRDRAAPDALTPDEHAVVTGSARGESDRALAARLGFATSTINGKKQSGFSKLRRTLERLGLAESSAASPGSPPAALPRSRATEVKP